jgi:hypothetical protein
VGQRGGELRIDSTGNDRSRRLDAIHFGIHGNAHRFFLPCGATRFTPTTAIKRFPRVSDSRAPAKLIIL